MVNENSYLEDLRNIYDVDLTAHRILITLVVDCSQEMAPHFNELEWAFNDFISKAKEDFDLTRCADFCVVTYGTQASVPIRPMSITKVDSVVFEDMGMRNTPKALEVAIREVKEWMNLIQNHGILVFVPWIVLMTSGCTTYSDDQRDSACCSRAEMGRIIEMSIQREAEKKHHVIAVGMGTDCDVNELERITDAYTSIIDWDFNQFFDWLSGRLRLFSLKTHHP